MYFTDGAFLQRLTLGTEQFINIKVCNYIKLYTQKSVMYFVMLIV